MGRKRGRDLCGEENSDLLLAPKEKKNKRKKNGLKPEDTESKESNTELSALFPEPEPTPPADPPEKNVEKEKEKEKGKKVVLDHEEAKSNEPNIERPQLCLQSVPVPQTDPPEKKRKRKKKKIALDHEEAKLNEPNLEPPQLCPKPVPSPLVDPQQKRKKRKKRKKKNKSSGLKGEEAESNKLNATETNVQSLSDTGRKVNKRPFQKQGERREVCAWYQCAYNVILLEGN